MATTFIPGTPPFIVINWCADPTKNQGNYGCDPCHLFWHILFGSVEGYVINTDGTIPIPGNFVYNSFWMGLGLISSDDTASPGQVVDGYLDLSLSGRWVGALPPLSVPTFPDPIQLVNANHHDVIYLTFNESGTITSFIASTDFSTHNASGDVVQSGLWSAISRLTINNCIMLDPTHPDQNHPPYNCVFPLSMIALPDPTIPPAPPVFISDFNDYAPTFTESGINPLTGQEIVVNHGFGYNDTTPDGPGHHWVIDESSPLITYQNAFAVAVPFIYRQGG